MRTRQPQWAFSDERFEEVKDDTDHSRNDVRPDQQVAGQTDATYLDVGLTEFRRIVAE